MYTTISFLISCTSVSGLVCLRHWLSSKGEMVIHVFCHPILLLSLSGGLSNSEKRCRSSEYGSLWIMNSAIIRPNYYRALALCTTKLMWNGMIITRGLLVRFSDGFPPNISSFSHSLHSAYKRLFGVLAVTDKFCSFELLEQWLDDEKRTHLSLPSLNSDAVASLARIGRENITIPKEERLWLLTELGAFDVAFGKEEEALRKSRG